MSICLLFSLSETLLTMTQTHLGISFIAFVAYLPQQVKQLGKKPLDIFIPLQVKLVSHQLSSLIGTCHAIACYLGYRCVDAHSMDWIFDCHPPYSRRFHREEVVDVDVGG